MQKEIDKCQWRRFHTIELTVMRNLVGEKTHFSKRIRIYPLKFKVNAHTVDIDMSHSKIWKKTVEKEHSVEVGEGGFFRLSSSTKIKFYRFRWMGKYAYLDKLSTLNALRSTIHIWRYIYRYLSHGMCSIDIEMRIKHNSGAIKAPSCYRRWWKWRSEERRGGKETERWGKRTFNKTPEPNTHLSMRTPARRRCLFGCKIDQ